MSLVFDKLLQPTLAIFNATLQFFNVLKGQRLTNNLAIWSHRSVLTAKSFAELSLQAERLCGADEVLHRKNHVPHDPPEVQKQRCRISFIVYIKRREKTFLCIFQNAHLMSFAKRRIREIWYQP